MSDISIAFRSLSLRRSSSQNVASGEVLGEMAVIAGELPRYQFHIQHEISAKTVSHSMTSWPVSANISRTKYFSKIQQATTKSMNESSQNQPGNLM